MRVTRVLQACPEVRLIVLFGSMATQTSGEHSDLDLIVVMDTDKPFLSRIDALLQRIQPEVDMDLLVYTPDEWQELRRDNNFVRRISLEGKVIYEAAAGTAGTTVA